MDIFCTALCLKNLKISLLPLIYALKCITNFKNQTKNCDEKISSNTITESNPLFLWFVRAPQPIKLFGPTMHMKFTSNYLAVEQKLDEAIHKVTDT